MATKTLKIQIVGDPSGAVSGANTAKQAMSSVAREAARVAAEQIKQAKEVARQIEVEAKRREDAQRKAFEAEARASQKASDEQVKAYMIAERQAQRAAATKEREARKAADAETREAKRSGDAQVKQAQRAGEAIAKYNKEGFDVASAASGQFKEALFGVVGQFTAINAAQAGFAALTGMWDTWKNDSLESAKNISNVREQLLELAALKGRLGDTTTENMDQLSFRAKTLQTAEAARMFQGEFKNVGDPLIGNRISAAESVKLMERAGQFQAAEGGDAATHARLAGIMPAMMGKDNVTADEAMAAEMKTYNQMQKGGFTFSSGGRQLIDKQSLVTSGVFKDRARMVGMLTAISNVVSPEQAGTTLEQVVDATTGSLRRMRQGKMEGDTLPASEYYKSLGANDQMDPAAISELVFQDFAKQETAEKSKGRDFNAWTYLQGKGFMNREAITGLMATYGAYKDKRWQGHMSRAASADGLTDADRADSGYVPSGEMMRRFDKSPVADSRRVETAKGMQTTIGGLPTEGYRKLQEMAFLNLKSRGEASGDSYESYAKDSFTGGAAKLDREIQRVMMQTAQRKGLPFDLRDTDADFGGYLPWETGEKQAKKFQGEMARIDGAAGEGSVMAEFVAEMKANTQAVTENSKKLEARRAGSAPLSISPADPMRRPTTN